MSVLIKDMKMPENCWECSSVELNVGVTMFDGICPFCMEIIKDHDMETGRHPDCPLVALPDHHGRLIDADALEPLCEINEDGAAEEYYLPWMIEDAPTIIEAEE